MLNSQSKSKKKPRGRPVGWKKDTHMKKEKSNKQKSITHRCYPDVMMDFFNDKVYEKLSSKHKDLLSTTPFLHLFCFPKKTQASCVVLHQILLMWDNTNCSFKFKRTILNFTSEEVSLVMCLPSKGNPVSYPRAKGAKLKPSVLRNKYFEQNKFILRKDLEDVILNALEENHEAKNVVGLLVMYLFTTVLFPQASGYVPVNMFQYAEDIENLRKYNWGNAVYRMLKDNIPACSLFCQEMNKEGKTKKNPKGQKPKGQLPGCALALIVWFFEHTRFSGALKHTGAIPRYLNWNLDKSWKRASFVSEIFDDRNVEVNGDKLEYDENEQLLKGCGFDILTFGTMLVDEKQLKLFSNKGVYPMLIQMSPILAKFEVKHCECIASQVQADKIQPPLPEVSSMVEKMCEPSSVLEHEHGIHANSTESPVEGAAAIECSPKTAVSPLKKRKLDSERPLQRECTPPRKEGIAYKELLILDPPTKQKKLLVLDVNGILADFVEFMSDHLQRQHIQIGNKYVVKRPFCDDFLSFCFTKFEVGIWSSRQEDNLKYVVHDLLGKLEKKLMFCWGQSKCTELELKTKENPQMPVFLKELKKLWDNEEPGLPWEKGQFTEANTLLVDDSPCKALCNPPFTAIFPIPYCYYKREDKSLGVGGDLRVYLEHLARAVDVPCFVKDHPQIGQSAITESHPDWSYYMPAIHNLKKSMISK